MNLVISQPMFLPWRGIFEQMRLCDTFIHYDDVQLPKGGGKGRGFITRVQIKTAGGIEWLSLPVARSDKGFQRINEARFTDQKWRARHKTLIERSYRHTAHFDETYEDVVKPVYAIETESLSEFCIRTIELLASRMGLSPTFLLSSQSDIPAGIDPSGRVLEFCRKLGADTYITGHGALNYLNYDIFEQAGISVAFMDYRLTSYPQLHGTFTPYVSILDLLFNVGPDAPRYLDSEAIYWKDFVKMRKQEG